MSKVQEVFNKVIDNMKKYVVGHADLLQLIVIALLTRGHILIEGPTGVGKTTVAKVFASLIGASFKRVQMTPDLLPSDIIGTYYFDMSKGEWILRKGPIFTNILFIDELNRAPPRTQAALLEAMQERQVSIEGRTFTLDEPFLVIATQMPVGTEGTYPLTPVLIDRFAYSYVAEYPSPGEEIAIMEMADIIEREMIKPVVSVKEVLEAQNEVEKVYVSDRVKKYIVDIVNYVRSRREVLVGPSPRASIWIKRGAKALAALEGMDFVLPDHVKKIAPYVLQHRIIIKTEYAMENIKPRDIIENALSEVEVPKV